MEPRVSEFGGWAQIDLAMARPFGRAPPAHVSRLERRIENPSIGIVEKLALTLGVLIAQMFAELGQDHTAPQPLRAGRKPKSSATGFEPARTEEGLSGPAGKGAAKPQ